MAVKGARVRMRRTLDISAGRFEVGLVGQAERIEEGSATVRFQRQLVRVACVDLEALDPRTRTWVPLTTDVLRAAIEEAERPAAPPSSPPPPDPPPPAPSRTAPTPSTSSGAERQPVGVFWAMIVVGIIAAIFGFTYMPAAPGSGADIDCAQIGHRVSVGAGDPHGLDRDGDGVGCEAEGGQFTWLGVLGLVGAAFGGYMVHQQRSG